MTVRATIAGHRKVNGDTERSYTVFCVNVFLAGKNHYVEKRYTEFEELHKQLRKKRHVPEFPPKKVLKWNSKVLEQRRQALQTYLQNVLYGPGPMPSCLLEFLKIPKARYESSLQCLDESRARSGITHQPIIAFSPDLYLRDDNHGNLPDIVTAGAIEGLYGSANSLR